MNLILFLLHYGMALSFLWIPGKYMLYYSISILIYLLIRHHKGKTGSLHRDVFPFIIGFGSVWVAQILPIMPKENVSFTFVLVVYAYALYREKKNEENGLKVKKEILKNIIYLMVLPLSAFLSILYLLEERSMAFLVYYAWLCFGVYESRMTLKSNAFLAFTLLNASLIMLYVFRFVPFQTYEKVLFLSIFIAVLMAKKTKTKFARG